MYRCLWYARGLCLCPCVITPRGFTSLPTQETAYSFTGFIPKNKLKQTNSNKQTNYTGCGLSCLVGLNSDLHRLCGSLHGLDTFGRAASGGALAPEPPRATRNQADFLRMMYQTTWHKCASFFLCWCAGSGVELN